MRYLNILLAAGSEDWALEEVKLRQVSQFLARKALSEGPEHDIEARSGQPRAQNPPPSAPGHITVLSVFGVLAQRMNLMLDFSGGTSTEILASDLRETLADPTIKAIVLDFDSPGGTVAGTDELATEIYNSRGVKPIVAVVNSMAASAAYWLAAQADEIVVTPSGQAGSIGIYTVHEDISKMLADQGVNTTLISAGKYKTEANPYGPLSEEAQAAIQARVDQSYHAFVTAVARGRGVSRSTVHANYGQGRMFGAAELIDRGMADRIGTLPQVLERHGAVIHPVASSASARRHMADIRQAMDALSQISNLLKVK